MYAVTALTVRWFSVPRIIRMLTAETPGDDLAARRTVLVAMVRALTR
jgi:hypothetical protein